MAGSAPSSFRGTPYLRHVSTIASARSGHPAPSHCLRGVSTTGPQLVPGHPATVDPGPCSSSCAFGVVAHPPAPHFEWLCRGVCHMRQNGGMTGTDDILDLRVTNEQRDRVIDYLGVALADGRLDHGEWEQRVEQAMRAKTRRELNATLRGLATVPLVSSAVSTRPLPTHGSSVGAGIVGLSALFTGPFGPLVGVAISERGSWSRRQIAKQANFQIDMFGLVVITMIVIGVGNMDLNGAVGDAMWAWGIVWVLGTLIRAIKAFEGTDWDDPVMKMLPRIVDEGQRPD